MTTEVDIETASPEQFELILKKFLDENPVPDETAGAGERADQSAPAIAVADAAIAPSSCPQLPSTLDGPSLAEMLEHADRESSQNDVARNAATHAEYAQVLARSLVPNPGDGARLIHLGGKIGKTMAEIKADVAIAMREQAWAREESLARQRLAEIGLETHRLQAEVAAAASAIANGGGLAETQRLVIGLLSLVLPAGRQDNRSVAFSFLRLSGWRLTGNSNWKKDASPGKPAMEEIASNAIKKQVIEELNSPNGQAIIAAVDRGSQIGGVPRMMPFNPGSLKTTDFR